MTRPKSAKVMPERETKCSVHVVTAPEAIQLTIPISYDEVIGRYDGSLRILSQDLDF
jgi:hypothetical protein